MASAWLNVSTSHSLLWPYIGDAHACICPLPTRHVLRLHLADVFLAGPGSQDLRSKTRVLDSVPRVALDCPVIEYDGDGNGDGRLHSVLYLRPHGLYPDPFRGSGHVLVLCDVMQPSAYDARAPSQIPHASNNRAPAERLLEAAAYLEPIFSVEQQYSLLDSSTLRPLGAFSPLYVCAPSVYVIYRSRASTRRQITFRRRLGLYAHVNSG